MSGIIRPFIRRSSTLNVRSDINTCKNVFKCKLLVVGGGTGGCSVAWRFSKKLNDKDIIVLEPSEKHFYQPILPLVAVGIADFSQSYKPLRTILPPNVEWLRDHAGSFDPCNNLVHTTSGFKVKYDFMVVALGLKNDYDQVLGLKKALNDPHVPVSTVYSPEYCQKCSCCIQEFKGGHAIFTFPKQSGKCSGAAQKIMYLAQDFWKQKNKCETNITYNTARSSLFGVPKYAVALSKIANNKNIIVNYQLDLIEVSKKGAVFVDCNGKTITLPYKFLHVTPSMLPPSCLSECGCLTDECGYLDVDSETLRHKRYPNVFGLGDCTNTPNSKTAAAVAKQSHVLEVNLWDTMYGQTPSAKYDGYGACVILTSHKTGILAEFLYDKKLCETFPFDQSCIPAVSEVTRVLGIQGSIVNAFAMILAFRFASKESRLIYKLYKDILPYMYWNKLVKGKWSGPSTLRNFLNPFGR